MICSLHCSSLFWITLPNPSHKTGLTEKETTMETISGFDTRTSDATRHDRILIALGPTVGLRGLGFKGLGLVRIIYIVS